MLFSFEYWQETTWFFMQFGSEWTQSFVNFSQTTNYKWHALQACAIMLSLKNLLMLISAKLHLKSCYYLDIYEQFFPCKSIFHSVYEKDEVLMAVGITAVSCGLFSTVVILFCVFFLVLMRDALIKWWVWITKIQLMLANLLVEYSFGWG